jgi:hypothetical protein
MLRRRGTVQRDRDVGLDELFWPGVSTVDDDLDTNDTGDDNGDTGDDGRAGEPGPTDASFGVAFFGWLVAGGTSVLLMALVGAACALIGWDRLVDWSKGWAFVGVWTLLVLSLGVGAFSGGYAGARMVSKHGVRQGLEVWVFSWCAAAVLAGLGYLAEREYEFLAKVDWPAVPVSEPDRTRAALIAAAAVLLVTLVGAVLGGASGNKR